MVDQAPSIVLRHQTLEDLARHVAPSLLRVYARVRWIAHGGRGRLPLIDRYAEAASQQLLDGPWKGKEPAPSGSMKTIVGASSLIRGIAASARDQYLDQAVFRLLAAVEKKLSKEVRRQLTAASATATGRAAGGHEVTIPKAALLHGHIDFWNSAIEHIGNRWSYIEWRGPHVVAAQTQSTNSKPQTQIAPMPFAKGEIPDAQHVEKMLAARPCYKSWEAVIANKIDLNQVPGQSEEAKRKRLVKKASAAARQQR